jgi:HPt (histidine-containing phosphotransfer) domain-containing protein
MKVQKDTQHFDLEVLRERLDNDDELIIQLLNMTKEYLIDFVPSIDQLLLDNNKPAIKSLAHKIKGTCLSVCLNEMAALAKELENLENYNQETFVELRNSINNEAQYLIKMIDNDYSDKK